MLRRTVALTAAYALALQAIFALAVTASLAGSHDITICRTVDTQPGVPARDKCEACLAGHCAGAAGTPERPILMLAWTASAGRAQTPPQRAAVGTPARKLAAHAPRAPPRS